MPLPPVVVSGVGPVTAEYSLWSASTFVVAGHRYPTRNWLLRNRVTLPGTSGPVEAKVTGALGIAHTHPTLVVDGVEHRFGPPTPWIVQVLALLPALVALAGDVITVVPAIAGLAANVLIQRQRLSNAARILAMTGIFLAAAAICVATIALG